MKNHKAACELADQALQDALEKIDELQEDDFRDAKSIIELLKENLTLWKEEEEGDDNQIDDLWSRSHPRLLLRLRNLQQLKCYIHDMQFFLCFFSTFYFSSFLLLPLYPKKSI